MDPIIFLLLSFLLCYPHALIAQSPTASQISVVGAVYCDTCSTNSFSKQSYFLPGVDVHIQCKFNAYSPKTTEQINFSVNGTTDKYGVYKLDIPSVDGVNCVDGLVMETMCQATLMRSSSPTCNVPSLQSTSNEISIKSKQDNICIYSLNALSFRPNKKNTTLCGYQKVETLSSLNSSKFFTPSSLNSSKCFLPFFPPYGFPWPPLPQLPFPPLPPFPYLPFPPLPFPNPPSLPFPFPPLPNFPPSPSLLYPTPPPAFNLRDPRTWIPNIPSAPPPPPPVFNLRDPKTWIPYVPPLPASSPQKETP
ncbi:Pollen Ole e 1 allergen/extensin [Quillaja saponaria]|uniref:Pollen Ole e 1 allergen/extensin n=1 Tax=Quillaja saponaria TaxID=32244 RepID=A0AAD7LG85_QUISA|nr:Pollen Ole e 1 allergen/extensin [Quillaja saponaria]